MIPKIFVGFMILILLRVRENENRKFCRKLLVSVTYQFFSCKTKTYRSSLSSLLFRKKKITVTFFDQFSTVSEINENVINTTEIFWHFCKMC